MFKMGKSIRDKNRKGGNCHSEKPNLHRWLGKCKILKINLKKKKFWESWVPSSRIGNFPESWCRDQFSGEEGSAGKWKSNPAVSTSKSYANNGSGIETPQSDLAALKQSLIENYIATGWPEPPLHSLLPCACGWIVHMWQQWFWEMRSRDSRYVLGGGTRHSCQDLDPRLRSISQTGECCFG